MQQGEKLSHHRQFQYHLQHAIPVEVTCNGVHVDIGVLTAVDAHFAELQGTLYSRTRFTFISRPGY
ncbi:hypothetical protein F4V43_12810 [Paenibacillus spiritus]|uniref:DUF2642 domain-containing protein n=1 Tax=Paenibacillus spiritus TaxID=2496557 RepID=A0A5J5G807_9BACL|nr:MULTISPECIES: hypothetical protein [Paenibacillus]KAA9003594.1 hypothetical protein F4V43_12810 [Paenibacillus spiritus]